MKNIIKEDRWVMLPKAEQEGEVPVGTICQNTQYGLFLWTGLHNENGSREGSQEYKPLYMKMNSLYLTSDDTLRDGDWYIYNNELLRQFKEKYNPSAKLIKKE